MAPTRFLGAEPTHRCLLVTGGPAGVELADGVCTLGPFWSDMGTEVFHQANRRVTIWLGLLLVLEVVVVVLVAVELLT